MCKGLSKQYSYSNGKSRGSRRLFIPVLLCSWNLVGARWVLCLSIWLSLPLSLYVCGPPSRAGSRGSQQIPVVPLARYVAPFFFFFTSGVVLCSVQHPPSVAKGRPNVSLSVGLLFPVSS